jgi:hypothetical protein
MVQLFKQEMLQTPGGFVFRGINASFRQEARGIDPRLRQQIPQSGILGFEDGFVSGFCLVRHERS